MFHVFKVKTIGVLLFSNRGGQHHWSVALFERKVAHLLGKTPIFLQLAQQNSKNHKSVAHFQTGEAKTSKKHRSVAHFQTGEAKTIGVLLFLNEK